MTSTPTFETRGANQSKLVLSLFENPIGFVPAPGHGSS